MESAEKITPLIPEGSSRFERDASERGLTRREVLAARSVLHGMTAEAAGQVMGVSGSTVGTYRRRAYGKLGVANAAELRSTYHEQAEIAGADVNCASPTASTVPSPKSAVDKSPQRHTPHMPLGSHAALGIAAVFAVLALSAYAITGNVVPWAAMAMLASLCFAVPPLWHRHAERTLRLEKCHRSVAVSADFASRAESYLRARGLNQTQASVLTRIAMGWQTGQIESELALSRGAVNSSRAVGYRMLGLHTRGELVVLLVTALDGTPAPEAESSRLSREADNALSRYRPAVSVVASAFVLLAGTATALALARAAATAGASLAADGGAATIESSWGPVPDVGGMQEAMACAALERADFMPVVEYEDSDGTPGLVIRQETVSLGTLSRDSLLGDGAASGTGDWKAAVRLVVSQLPLAGVLMSGTNPSNLVSELGRLGYHNVSVEFDGGDDGGPCIVTGSNPELPSRIGYETPITIFATNYVEVPNVVGMSMEEAQLALDKLRGFASSPDLSLGFSWVTGDPSGSKDGPRIVSQSPEPGTRVHVGYTVSVELSEPVALGEDGAWHLAS